MLYHFVITFEATDQFGATHRNSLDGTMGVEGLTRSDVIRQLRDHSVESHGEVMRNAVITFFSLEPDEILPARKHILF